MAHMVTLTRPNIRSQRQTPEWFSGSVEPVVWYGVKV